MRSREARRQVNGEGSNWTGGYFGGPQLGSWVPSFQDLCSIFGGPASVRWEARPGRQYKSRVRTWQQGVEKQPLGRNFEVELCFPGGWGSGRDDEACRRKPPEPGFT